MGMLKTVLKTRPILCVLIGGSLVGLVGCGNRSLPNNSGSNQNSSSPAAGTTPSLPAGPMPNNVPPSGNANDPKFTTKHYSGVGVITKINQDMGTVGLDHEEIKGLMPAMSMEYYLKEKSLLVGLKVGQKVDFTIEDYGNNETISAITPRTK
jgi:Cu(I)/Ag(I) efflux system protein CusF